MGTPDATLPISLSKKKKKKEAKLSLQTKEEFAISFLSTLKLLPDFHRVPSLPPHSSRCKKEPAE